MVKLVIALALLVLFLLLVLLLVIVFLLVLVLLLVSALQVLIVSLCVVLVVLLDVRKIKNFLHKIKFYCRKIFAFQNWHYLMYLLPVQLCSKCQPDLHCQYACYSRILGCCHCLTHPTLKCRLDFYRYTHLKYIFNINKYYKIKKTQHRNYTHCIWRKSSKASIHWHVLSTQKSLDSPNRHQNRCLQVQSEVQVSLSTSYVKKLYQTSIWIENSLKKSENEIRCTLGIGEGPEYTRPEVVGPPAGGRS